MQKLTILVVLGLITIAFAQRNNLDNVNIDAILNNDRVLNNYIKCLLDQGSCTREGRELKKLLPNAIQSDCSQCTPAQQRNSRKVITFLRTRRPQEWKQLTDKYDPQGLVNRRIAAGTI